MKYGIYRLKKLNQRKKQEVFESKSDINRSINTISYKTENVKTFY